jgi:predicted nucleotidyltransferase
MSLETIQSIIVPLLGDNVLGIIVFGSASRLEDFSPLSDVNVAIITRDKISLEERVLIAEELGQDVSTLILTIDELKKLLEDGEFLAHELLGDSKLIYADESLYEVINKKPPITTRTLEYLEKNALACLNISLENYFTGRFHDSLNYAYRSLRSAVRLLCTSENRLLFKDREILTFLEEKGLRDEANIYRKLRSGRFRGIGKGELFKTLIATYTAVFNLLGFKGVDPEKLVDFIEKNYAYISRIKIDPVENRLHVTIKGLDLAGKETHSELYLGDNA